MHTATYPQGYADLSEALSKVPEVTLLFWIVKIAATTFGEVGGHALSMSLNLGYPLGTGIFAALFIMALTAQMRTRQFRPWVYWATIVATTTVGTTLADHFDRSMGVGYGGGTTIMLVLLLTSLWTWQQTLRTVSVERVSSPKAEIFCWVTIMFSQTLGTALGDRTADTAGLGYSGGALVFTGLLLLVVAAYRWTRISRTALFWAASVLTRPLGAVVSDYLNKPVAAGSLALSRFGTSAVLPGFIAARLLFFTHRASLKEH